MGNGFDDVVLFEPRSALPFERGELVVDESAGRVAALAAWSTGRPRLLVASLLAFDGPTRNALDTTGDRDFALEALAAASISAMHLSRFAEEIVIWVTPQFGFIKLTDRFTTGSSIMPQKKNPDSCELLRGKSARLQGNLHTLLTLAKGLPLTYNRDLQEDKPPVFDSFDQTAICADVLAGTLAGMTVNRARCAEAV